MKEFKDISYGEFEENSLDIYLPDSESFPVFIYFHGGCLNSGDKAHQRVLSEYLANNGIAVVTANYRKYPSAHYPDFLCDAAKVTAWVINNINKYGNAKGIYVGGSSAGGYISQMLCFDESYLAECGIKATDISGYIHDAGQPTVHFSVLNERGIDSRRVIVDDSSALYHICADKTYPPMLIIVSDNDMQNRYEQTMLLVSTLKHFGYEDLVSLKIMNGTHCAYVDRVDEAGNSILGKMVLEFILSR